MHLSQAKKLIHTLRKRYPNVISSLSGYIWPARYCVGGVLGRGCASPWRQLYYRIFGFPLDGRYYYPEDVTLADTLREYNPDLPEDDALNLADYIVNANDSRNFDEAWRIALVALTWPNYPQESSSAELAA